MFASSNTSANGSPRAAAAVIAVSPSGPLATAVARRVSEEVKPEQDDHASMPTLPDLGRKAPPCR
jgi:hypothetical protein